MSAVGAGFELGMGLGGNKIRMNFLRQFNNFHQFFIRAKREKTKLFGDIPEKIKPFFCSI